MGVSSRRAARKINEFSPRKLAKAMARFFGINKPPPLPYAEDAPMQWNGEPIPYELALKIGWNLPMDMVGAGVYGGICKRSPAGKILVGDEWPEDNMKSPAHNQVHCRGPYLDFAQFTSPNRGYTEIARLIVQGRGGRARVAALHALFHRVPGGRSEQKKLANLVMTGGARPLHMCGMNDPGPTITTELVKVLLDFGADVNAKDNYECTPLDRFGSNNPSGQAVLLAAGGVAGQSLPRGQPQWTSDQFDYRGPGEAENWKGRSLAGADAALGTPRRPSTPRQVPTHPDSPQRTPRQVEAPGLGSKAATGPAQSGASSETVAEKALGA